MHGMPFACADALARHLCTKMRLSVPRPTPSPVPRQQTKFKGCCCEACQEAPRLLRPAKTRGLYGNWSEYAEGESKCCSCSGSASREWEVHVWLVPVLERIGGG